MFTKMVRFRAPISSNLRHVLACINSKRLKILRLNGCNEQLLSNVNGNSFSSLFILDVATYSQKDHKLFSATYILCSKKFSNLKAPHY